MDEGHAIRSQEVLNFLEECLVVRHTDMFEHADGDNPVIFSGDVAIVFQMKQHVLAIVRFLHPLLGDNELFLGKCNSLNNYIMRTRKFEC